MSNGFQAELFVRLGQQFEVKAGYNYLDVYRMLGEEKQVLPFNPKHRLLGTFSFKPRHNKFHFDVMLSIFQVESKLWNTYKVNCPLLPHPLHRYEDP